MKRKISTFIFCPQNAVQTSWPGNRQMALVPSWQQIPPQHAAATIQQPAALLSDAADWGRPLLVDSSAILQEQRPVYPVDVAAEIYNPAAMIEHPSGGWSSSSSKRSSKNHHVQQSSSHHGHHHLMVSFMMKRFSITVKKIVAKIVIDILFF